MNLNEFAKEIHENSVAHGWWDEPRPFDELCALMISELSEALEEARAGRPMEYRVCGETGEPCDRTKDCWHVGCTRDENMEGRKPEGIAVEMADCAIRILDYLGSVEYELEEFDDFDDPVGISTVFMRVVGEIVRARIYHKNYFGMSLESVMLEIALHHILSWFEGNGLDFEYIARRKHEYNKTRPYKHGKTF